MKSKIVVLLFFTLCLTFTTTFATDPLTQALKEQRAADKRAVASQKRVEKLDDESRLMLEEYRLVNQELDRLKPQNDQRQRLVSAQNAELEQIAEELKSLEDTQRDIEPLMDQMLDVLVRFVALDTPFLPEERRVRIAGLQELSERADADLPEKYRRLLEAYQVESEYGRTIEAYRGELEAEGKSRLVEFLRLGRVALYYLTLDGAEAGIWDARQANWLVLPSSFNSDIERAMRIARKQLPPDLMPLPLFAPGETRPAQVSFSAGAEQ